MPESSASARSHESPGQAQVKSSWGFGRLRFLSSGYSRPNLDAALLCERCTTAWEYGDWFPRRCRDCHDNRWLCLVNEMRTLRHEARTARQMALRDVFEALMAEEFDGDGIWYVLPHWTTYKGAAQFLARKFAIADGLGGVTIRASEEDRTTTSATGGAGPGRTTHGTRNDHG